LEINGIHGKTPRAKPRYKTMMIQSHLSVNLLKVGGQLEKTCHAISYYFTALRVFSFVFFQHKEALLK